MGTGETKADRLLKIEALLLAHPEGLTQSEIARRLDVHRSTVSRYVPSLPGHVYIDDEDGDRWKIDRSAYLVRVRLNLHEALALHMATRLLATRTDRHNPHAAAALRKLAEALNRLAPDISAHMQVSADVMDGALRSADPGYVEVLENLTLAWAERKKARVWHRHQPSGKVYEYVFSPYFIEPYAIGRTAHVIGYREPPGAVRTFKIERVERVALTPEGYEIPEDFEPRALLSEAWGIWYSDAEPVRVRLRFSPAVVERVKETVWQPGQKIEDQEDGSCLWEAEVAEWREMLPWIRGWGADVEVLGPEELRQGLAAESRRLARFYGWEVHRATRPKPAADEHQFFDDFFGG